MQIVFKLYCLIGLIGALLVAQAIFAPFVSNTSLKTEKQQRAGILLFNTKGLPKYAKVPGMTNATFFIWETDPQQIIMLENSHLKWYETKSERNVIALQRYLLSSVFMPNDGIVVDMGINDGYIAALAAAYGYNTIGVDGQPECVRRFLIATRLNPWGELISVHNNIVCSKTFVLPVRNGICGGGSRYLENGNPEPNLKTNKGAVVEISGTTNVSTIALDTLVSNKPIVFFHLDVEGAELEVLLSAKRALKNRQIKNVVWEFAPHRWIKAYNSSLLAVKDIFKAFTCRDVAALTFRYNPFKSPLVIDNWDSEFERASTHKRIYDIWCTLPDTIAV